MSINDPEKMTNTCNLSTLLIENKKNLLRYDLLAPYSIITPNRNAFTSGDPDYGKLELDSNNKPRQQDLFPDYLKLTINQVAQSYKWYSAFVPTDQSIQEDLSWSLLYYKKNVDSNLYLKVYSKLIRNEAAAQGGPLFLKLLLDSVTTTGEQNLKSLVTIVETSNASRTNSLTPRFKFQLIRPISFDKPALSPWATTSKPSSTSCPTQKNTIETCLGKVNGMLVSRKPLGSQPS